jgi:hypothetical protein
VIYLYAGEPGRAQTRLARAKADDAAFCGSNELKAWVSQGLDELG